MSAVMKHFHEAAKAIESKDFRCALEHFEAVQRLEIGDDGMENALRRTYCYFAWANLGIVYPPALSSLEAELNALRSKTSGDVQNEKNIKAIEGALDFVAAGRKGSPLS